MQRACDPRGSVMDTAGKFYFLGFEHILYVDTVVLYLEFVLTNSVFWMEIPSYLVAYKYLIHTAESETFLFELIEKVMFPSNRN